MKALTRSRLFALLAICLLTLLFIRNPIIMFLAACYACLTLPLYRKLKLRAKLSQLKGKGRKKILHWFVGHAPLWSYILILIASIFVPIAVLILLVAPQAVAGLAKLRELQANNFQLPAEWVAYIQQWRADLEEYPHLVKMINEFVENLDSIFGDAVGMLVSQSFGFLGGTMNVLWTTFLFLALSIVFSVYARRIRKIARHIVQLPMVQFRRFIRAVHRALRAIMLGIILVALVQGVLCGIGFAIAGISQAAFWGMLATFVAPIPFIGTALVWLPLCISLWFSGKTMTAVGLVLWGTIAVSGVDNILRPLFLQQGIRAPFFVLILAMVCGMATFGAIGLIAGPVTLALALQLIEEAGC